MKLKCRIPDICQALAINQSRVLGSKMENSIAEEDTHRLNSATKFQGNILKRHNETISRINENNINKQKI